MNTNSRPSRNSTTKKVFTLKSKGVLAFLEAYERAQQVFIDAGYDPLKGTPVGYLYDVPAISAEIKNLTDKVAKDHPDR